MKIKSSQLQFDAERLKVAKRNHSNIQQARKQQIIHAGELVSMLFRTKNDKSNDSFIPVLPLMCR